MLPRILRAKFIHTWFLPRFAGEESGVVQKFFADVAVPPFLQKSKIQGYY